MGTLLHRRRVGELYALAALKPIPSPVVLGQVTEKFAISEGQQNGTHPRVSVQPQGNWRRSRHQIRQQRRCDGIIFIGVAQEKAQAFQGKKINGRFQFTRDKPSTNHYYFYIDDGLGSSHALRALGNQVVPERA